MAQLSIIYELTAPLPLLLTVSYVQHSIRWIFFLYSLSEQWIRFYSSTLYMILLDWHWFAARKCGIHIKSFRFIDFRLFAVDCFFCCLTSDHFFFTKYLWELYWFYLRSLHIRIDKLYIPAMRQTREKKSIRFIGLSVNKYC